MAALKSTLFQNATIITYDTPSRSLKILRNASMLVEAGRITQLQEGDLPNIPPDTEVVDATNQIISPGFIDTHHHMWSTAFRSIAADTTLHEYFVRYGQTGPAGQHFTPEDVYLGQLASAIELIDCGTTTVLDHAHGTFSDEHIDAVVNADFESGLRIIHAHCVSPTDVNGYSYEQSLAKFKKLMADPRFATDSSPVELGLAYDGFAFAPSSRSMEVMDVVIAHNNSAPANPISCLTTHHVSGPYGVNNGPSALDSFPTSVVTQPKLDKKLPVIISHASFLSPSDAALLRQNAHVTISTTPESEAHYGHTSDGADMCQDCASLGVDTHFTFSSYMPEQARLWLQMIRSKWYHVTVAQRWEIPANTPMKVEDAFLLMTQKGGEALARDDLGVIRVGAVADLVILDRGRPGMWATGDPVAAVVLHSCAGDIDGVMVSGRWVKKGSRVRSPLTGGEGTVNVEDVRRRFEESARKIQDIWAGLEKPVFATGGKAMIGPATYGECKKIQVEK